MKQRGVIIAVVIIAALIGVAAFVGMQRLRARTLSRVSSSGESGSASALLTRAHELENAGQFPEARSAYQKLVTDFPGAHPNDITAWQKKVEDLYIALLFSSTPTPNSTMYEIKPGDTIAKIAREFKTTPELIMKSNSFASDKIIPGRQIKIWTAPFTILVDKSQNTLLLKVNEEVVRSYVVSTGKNNCTPVGVFRIVNKLPRPTWFKAGAVVPPNSPQNILGSRWMGFDLAGYGIHGTTEPKSLGTQATQGCVRMANSEVEELYTIVPVGTEVTIVD